MVANPGPAYSAVTEELRRAYDRADGWCAGCLGDFGTFRLHPCYLATWAMEITAVPESPS